MNLRTLFVRMMTESEIVVRILSLIALAFSVPAIGLAQTQVRARHGVWLGLGLGYGSARFSCDTCAGRSSLGGWVTALDMGGTVSPHLELGGELRTWMHGLNRDKLPGLAALDVLVTYYPRTDGGPFVEGGTGLSVYVLGKGTGDPIEPFSRDTTYNSGTGFGFTLAAGWEIGGFSPRIVYVYGNELGLHTPNGTVVTKMWKQKVLVLELALRGDIN
jgi:hypothetical protein